jgi:[ribosomal protein S18]-alanine N-acetyltransferase
MSVVKKAAQIRKMREDDVLAIVSVEMGAFAEPWPEKVIRYELNENPCSHLYVATIDDEVVGYLDFMITFDSATISRLAVNESNRRKGIGQALINKMIVVCKRQKEEVSWITLEVRPSNVDALGLYTKNEWKRVTTKKGYYSDGEDAIYMVRSI